MNSTLRQWMLILVLYVFCPAQPARGSDFDVIATEVDKIIAESELGRFRGAVVVRVGGQNVISRGYGYENEELHAIDPQVSLFDVGSVAKSVTAATILRLIEQDKLRLTSTMGDIFAEQAGNLSHITVEDLLRHRSGIGSGGRALSQPGALDTADALLDALGQAVLNDRAFQYSNVGYFLLAAVIEKAADAPFEEVTRDLVFNHAGLSRIGFVGDGSVQDARPMARVSRTRQGRITTPLFDYPWNWGQRGATGVLMTPQTVADWIEALEEGDWLADASREAMLAPDDSTYGLGLYVLHNNYGEITRFGHGGSTGGFVCDVARYPLAVDGQGATIVLMAEAGIDIHPISQQIVKLIWTPPAMPSFAGVYLSAYEEFHDDGIYTVSDGLSWRVQPQYVGSDGTKRIVEDRPTIILEDRARRMWSLMIRMDEDKALDLVSQLERVSSNLAQDPVGGKTPWHRGITLVVDSNGLELNEYDSYSIENGAVVNARLSNDHHIELVIVAPDGKHELARVRMGGASSKALREQIRAVCQ